MSKRDAEDIIISSGIEYTIIRTSGIFGTNDSTGKTNFFTWIYRSLKEGKEINLVIDQLYSPVLNNILADAIYEIYDREINGIIHFSSIDAVSRLDFGNMVAYTFNFNRELIHPVKMKEMPWIARRPKDSSLNNDKAVKYLRIKPIEVWQDINKVKEIMNRESPA